MGYTALYRKFRPINFQETVGQEHITRTLRNQIVANRIGHAYLLNGGRGTGKTSTAKILARAINCENPNDGEPCNECDICKDALSGALTDIVEMDAASNNSVEDIRAIRDEVNFLPTKAKYRIYIIDEVHMLSIGAFNALLKTLEEPPDHVKFILATTEPQKLPATILSRCQRFDFKQISNTDIIQRLEIVCRESQIEISESALNIIAVLSEGALRDSLSILERCIQDGEQNINEDKVKDLVGIPKIAFIHNITTSIVLSDIDKSIEYIHTILDEGKNIVNILWEIIKYVKDVLVYKVTNSLNMYNEEELKNIADISNKISKEDLTSLIYRLSELESDIKQASQKNIMFEAGIIKLCSKESKTMQRENPEEHTGEAKVSPQLEVRIEKIENYLRNAANSTQQPRQASKPVELKSNIQVEHVKTTSSQNNKNLKFSQGASRYWPEILDNLKQTGKMVLYTNLIGTEAVEANDLITEIIFTKPITSFAKTVLEKQENIRELTTLASIACGREVNIKYVTQSANEVKTKDRVQDLQELANGADIPFNIVE